MLPEPVVLLVPSLAAATELPRRRAGAAGAVAGLYPLRLLDLARAVAEPVLLGRGCRAWDAGHDALLAARLLEEDEGRQEGGLRLGPDVPRPPVARALARTLSTLRAAGIEPSRLEPLAGRPGTTPEDARRLRAVAGLYRRFHEAVEERFADPVTLLRTAARHLHGARWLEGACFLIVDELELAAVEKEFVGTLSRLFPVHLLEAERPPSLHAASFAAWAVGRGIRSLPAHETVLAPLVSPSIPAGLGRLRTALFEAPRGPGVRDGGVELLTAPGETAEVRAVARRLLRAAARGVGFEEMGVILPRPHEYAPMFADLLDRLGIPYRLHPSLPLRFGRSARSLLLLFRCRRLSRSAVMEFLTFAPVPYEVLLGEAEPRLAQWDAISRDAGIVSGLERWIIGLRAHAEAERDGADREENPERRERRLRRASDAEALLRVVEILSATLDGLAGEAPWPEWSERLRAVLEQWVGPERDRAAVSDVLADLAGLGSIGARAPWREVEQVLEARFEWERMPLEPVSGGAVHVGAMDAMAGLPFRLVAIPGLVEGGYPGVLRPDPFLLDPEREALALPLAEPSGRKAERPKRARSRQLSLFDDPPPGGSADVEVGLPTTQDRLWEERRLFHRAVRQATERLILSYPRAEPRSGRERLPSLFFVAAASALEGRPLGAPELDRMVSEDDIDDLPLEETLDRSERDRARVRRGRGPAAEAIAAGSSFFKQSRLASQGRWSGRLTAYDGLVAPLPPDLAQKLDPVASRQPVSASRLADFSKCGFLYLLKHVLRLEPALEPEERKRLEPLERGDRFHKVAERFLRERRDRGELPVRDDEGMRARLLELADQSLDELVSGSPPRFAPLWERERRRFRETMLGWLAREAAGADRATPAWFEVGFGLRQAPAPGEPDLKDPLEIDIGDGRSLRLSGKIDRIDRRDDGTLVLRDYKTGRAPPRDEGRVFRGGMQLQIPFYILAASRLFPDQPVVEAFLDYVDAARQVAVDPEVVRGEAFSQLMRGLVDLIAQGTFVQEPASCEWCDYTAVCGPRPLLERRRQIKLRDPRMQRMLQVRSLG